MTTRTRASKPRTAARTRATPRTVDDFVGALDFPLARELAETRRVILGVDPAITEAIKWNAPSFRTTDFFATVNLRSRASLQLVFHTGAKAKATARTGIPIEDPAGLIRWLAKDRCLVTLGAGRTFDANRRPFAALVQQWIRWV